MSDLSKYFGNQILRWMAGDAMPSAPATLWFALFDGDPKGAGTEISEDVVYTGRHVLTLEAIPNDGEDNNTANSNELDFGNSENEVDLSHVAVFDDPSGGNLLFSKALAGGPFSITVGMPVKFAVGAVTFTLGD